VLQGRQVGGLLGITKKEKGDRDKKTQGFTFLCKRSTQSKQIAWRSQYKSSEDSGHVSEDRGWSSAAHKALCSIPSSLHPPKKKNSEETSGQKDAPGATVHHGPLQGSLYISSCVHSIHAFYILISSCAMYKGLKIGRKGTKPVLPTLVQCERWMHPRQCYMCWDGGRHGVCGGVERGFWLRFGVPGKAF
jgi:hypothetical protein